MIYSGEVTHTSADERNSGNRASPCNIYAVIRMSNGLVNHDTRKYKKIS